VFTFTLAGVSAVSWVLAPECAKSYCQVGTVTGVGVWASRIAVGAHKIASTSEPSAKSLDSALLSGRVAETGKQADSEMHEYLTKV
jgi:hypothetical protein